jgi:hypothetical protein
MLQLPLLFIICRKVLVKSIILYMVGIRHLVWRLEFEIPGKKWDEVGSGLLTKALSTYLWYEPILSLSLNYSILSLSFKAPYRNRLEQTG